MHKFYKMKNVMECTSVNQSAGVVIVKKSSFKFTYNNDLEEKMLHKNILVFFNAKISEFDLWLQILKFYFYKRRLT